MVEHLTGDQMKDLYKGNLSEEETKYIETHLSACEQCDREYAHYLAVTLKHENETDDQRGYDIHCSNNDRKLKCVICGHDSFHHRYAKLNTSILTFFGLDWLNKTADCYVCKSCGYVHWFI